LIGLFSAREVRRPGTYDRFAALLDACDELPPLPAVALALADEPGVLPIASADAHVDPLDGCSTGPSDAADRDVTRLDLFTPPGFSEQGAHSLERDRFPDDMPVAF